MKKYYIVKDIITDTQRDGETLVYYLGKDGYVWDDPKSPDGWSRYSFADNYISKNIRGFDCTPTGRNTCIEGKRWNHEYSIMEVWGE